MSGVLILEVLRNFDFGHHVRFTAIYVIRTNKMHTLFINDLIQLYCLRHVSNNQVFILTKTCTCSFMAFCMHPYEQPGRWQDVSKTSWHDQTAYMDAWKNTLKLHVQVFVRMNTWLFETCRRQYHWIKSLMKIFFLFFSFPPYVYHNAQFKKCKICCYVA